MTTSRHGMRAGGLAGVLAALAALAAPALVGGCDTPEPETRHPVWPGPPEPARVVHRANVRQAGDLAKPAPFSGLARLITGDTAGRLLRPHGVAVESGRRLYVTDQERQGVYIFDMKAAGEKVITRVDEEFLVSPVGVAACGEWFAFSDSALKKVFVMTPEGKLVRTIVKPGGFGRPAGLAYEPRTGRLHVADTLANEICSFNLRTGELVARFGAPGEKPGQFNMPTHLFVDGSGRFYVADSMNFRVQIFDAAGRFVSQVGKLGDASGHMAVPKGLAVDSHGHIYIVDSYFSTVQIFDDRGTFLLAFGSPGVESGSFQVPAGLTVDADNRIYVCDTHNRRVQIFQYVGDASDAAKPSPR